MGCGKSKNQHSALANSSSNSSINGNKTPIVLKVAVSGEMGVGKTSIIARYVENKFSEETEPTTYDNESKHKEITVDGQTVKFTIYDSLGQERDRTITRPNYPKPLAAMVCSIFLYFFWCH